MPETLIHLDRVGKKFCRSLHSAALYGAADALRKLFRCASRTTLRANEFWALQQVSLTVDRGECVGVIGPNGAGKTTLLRLMAGEYRPDAGSVRTRGNLKSLIRIGMGLHPLLTGRENIYSQCMQFGLQTRDVDRLLHEIVAFAELETAIDRPVKTYSDGMYARLEFSITAALPMDVLLVDEALAVGDVAFQMRCLERLNRLKENGAAIVMVSHSEMNIRQVADRCLLLFGGRPIAQGMTDELFYQYYASIGYLNRKLEPLGTSYPQWKEQAGDTEIVDLQRSGGDWAVRSGGAMELRLGYRSRLRLHGVALILQFWNPARILVASVDSRMAGVKFELDPGSGSIKVKVPYLSLAPGLYRVSASLRKDQDLLAHRNDLVELPVVLESMDQFPGFSLMGAEFEQF